MEEKTRNLPALALRGTTAFPRIGISFDVSGESAIRALEYALETDQDIFLVTRRDLSTDVPEENDIYRVGTICHIKQLLRVGGNAVRVMMDGIERARLKRLWQREPYLQTQVEVLEAPRLSRRGARTEVMLRCAHEQFERYVKQSRKVSDDVCAEAMLCNEPGYLADFIALHGDFAYTDKQTILEELRPVVRLRLINELLAHEIDANAMEREIEERVRLRVGQTQKEHILREQMRVLQEELGEDDENEFEAYRRAIEEAKLPEKSKQKLMRDVDRLAKQPFGSTEASVLRGYLDTCMEMPWGVETKERADVAQARKILDREHYGMEKVKERILEFVAVRQLNPTAKGDILCLVGPPGVGKTSIALSVAKALNRKVGRLSLGGVRDEADIRGHRKTYVGAMPGRIVEAIKRSGTMNPLLVLDEIDKLASDNHGDPSSALLEVLDSEQNYAFRDHYLEIPVDLSHVSFITTANTTDTIPRPLLDRMEVIELPSYTDEEKLQIAQKYLLPKAKKECGISPAMLRVDETGLRRVITDYTREAGVRQLERCLKKLCQKAAMSLAGTSVKRINITEKNLQTYLGTPLSSHGRVNEYDLIGVSNGLAWTELGGELLPVEVSVLDGTGKLELTGNLGDVMQESCKAALSYLRSRADSFGIATDFYKTKDIHIHFPEAAVPKDGPSAGIAIATALLSALTGRKVRHDVAMTGEISLRGRILPIGGLREKTMGALRAGATTVLLPKENEKDLADIDPQVREKLRFVLIEEAETAFAEALCEIESQVTVCDLPLRETARV